MTESQNSERTVFVRTAFKETFRLNVNFLSLLQSKAFKYSFGNAVQWLLEVVQQPRTVRTSRKAEQHF